MEQLPIFLISLFLFVGFLNTNIEYNKCINTIAATTFGIYLIHDSTYARRFLWKLIFRNADFTNSILLIPYSLGCVIIVFIICALIELFRIRVLENHYLKVIEKISNYIENCINKFFNLKIFKGE